MKQFLIIYLLPFFCLPSFSQQKEIDSLKLVLKTVKEDINKVDILYLLSVNFCNIQSFDSSLKNADAAISLARVIGLKKGEAKALAIKGFIYENQGNYPEALKNYFACLKIRETTKEKDKIAHINFSIGLIYEHQNIYPEALNFYKVALDLFTIIGNKQGMSDSQNRIGIVYAAQGNYTEALQNHFTYLKLTQEIGDKLLVSNAYNEIANDYLDQGNLTEGLKTHLTNLKLGLEIGDKFNIAESYNNIGVAYARLGNFSEALKNHFTSLKIYEELDDKYSVGGAYNNIGWDYYSLKNYTQAEEYSIKGLNIAKEINDWMLIKEANENLSNIYIALGKSQKAIDYYKAAILANDSIKNEEGKKRTLQIQMQYNFDKKEAIDSLKISEERKLNGIKLKQEKTQRYALYIGLIFFVSFSIFIFNRLQITKKQKILLEIKEREAHEQNIIISQQKHLVEEKQKEITDSINYTQRLQQAILPPIEFIFKNFPNSFVLYKPKDIVAGDFYWAEQINDLFFIAAADCTGHGVPGAMVSVVCSNALNRTVNEFGIKDTGKILDKTRELVIQTFEKSNEDVKDGMDISLLCIDEKNKEVFWSGANNPLWFVINNELIEIKADKQPVGKSYETKSFTSNKIEYKTNTTFYLFTDGLADQFGGPNGKKFKYKQFEEILISINNKSMQEQSEIINKKFEEWKGTLEQVDDVCVIGIKI